MTPTVTESELPSNPLKKVKKKLLVLAGGIGALLLGTAVYAVMKSSEPALLADNFFSRGEESLLREKRFDSTLCKQALGEKEEGMKAFENQRYEDAQSNFQTAISLFKQATKKCAVDPETLIFLNNAKAIIKGNPVTIAAAIPGKNKERNTKISEQILRGVASVQETLNNQDGIEGRLLQVVIARDENNSDPDVENTSPKVA